MSNLSTCRPPFTSACSVEPNNESCKRSSRQSRKVGPMCRYPRNARPRLEHQQANHAQRHRPSGRNRPSRKNRAPLLLRCLASQHLKLRGALMAPHGADVGVYVRGALSGFAACRRKAKHGDISHRPAIGRYHHQLSSIATRMTPPLPRRPANSLNKPTQF